MFPDPKIDTELMVLIFVAETKVSCLLAARHEKRKDIDNFFTV
jgi:hypothetical protein